MKQRTYFLTFALFLISVNIGILLIVTANLRDVTQQAKERSMGEQLFIATAIFNDMTSLESRDIEVFSQIGNIVSSYGYISGGGGTTFSFFKDGRLIYSTASGVQKAWSETKENERRVSTDKSNGKYIVTVSGNLPAPYGDCQIVYSSDITKKIDGWNDNKNLMFIIGNILSAVVALVLMFLLNGLFKPLFQATKMAQQIASGSYDVRIHVKGKDEVAKMARSFNKMAEQVEHHVKGLANEAENRQRFADNLAHELRTPLTAIYGYAEYIQKTNCNEEELHFALNCILTESRRMQLMSNQLMDLANLRKNQIKKQDIEVSALLNMAKQSVSLKLIEKNMNMNISSDIYEINGDETLLHSLIVNLIDNAIKASECESEIEIKAFYENEKPVISVRDFGKGMNPTELSKITDPYYRIEKSRTRQDGGAGLGLAICSEIAARHDAKFEFKSAVGYGTTVKITFTT